MTQTVPQIVVALVSDSGDNRALVRALLSQAHGDPFRVDHVPIAAAPDALAARRHDVCLLDLSPGFDGAGVLRAALDARRPVLVLTDVEDPEAERPVFATGVWDCLAVSSVTARQLAKSIRRAIDQARQIDAFADAQVALAASEGRFRSLVRNAVHGILRTTPDGLVLEANPAAASMLGRRSEDELAGSCILDAFKSVSERDRLLAACRAGGNLPPAEVEWKRPDGSTVWVRLSGRAVEADDAAGGFEFLVEDVTEYRSLESQFRQAQKMEAVGRLAGGVAHDFNNLLTALLGYAEMLRDQIGVDDPRRHHVDELRLAAERGSALTRQLLTFSRKPTGQPRTLDLNAVVGGFDKMLRRIIGEHIVLRTVAGKDLGLVRADPGQVEQVLMNLAVNSRDAMPDGGSLTIETGNVDLEPSYTRTHAAVEPGRYVMVAVTDTGCGMTSEVRAHLFEPFFTTKESGKGSGLGLATVYGIVHQNGGHIWVYSEPGKGSTFKIYLPRVEAAAEAADARPARTNMPIGSETVLLVEDEPSVRTLIRDVLARQGYHVLVANQGREALALALAHQGPIDLVLSDVVMPEVSGPDLVRHLLWTRPKIRVLFVSGYTDQTVSLQASQEAWTAFLQKPFTPDGLARAVRDTLDGTARA